MPESADPRRDTEDFAHRAERELGQLAERAERDIGKFIRDLRNGARISLRELANRAGVSNPYLSQIERGLRRPSAEVLAQLADALRVSTALMYLRAGLLPEREGHSVVDAITADPELTLAQKQSLTSLYEAFRRENARAHGETPATTAGTPSGRGRRNQPTTSAPSGRGRRNQKEAIDHDDY